MDLALPMARSWADVAGLGVLVAIALPVCVIDVRRRRIPDVIVLPALALVVLLRAVWGTAGWGGVLLWAGAAGLMLLVPAIVRPDGMGMGDVKLAGLIGACLGAVAIGAVLLALVAGAVGGAAHARLRGVSLRDATIPFGPYLLAAALAVALPVAFVHSAHAAGHHHDLSDARTAVRPARVGIGRIGRHQALGGARAAGGPRNERRRMGAHARCAAATAVQATRCWRSATPLSRSSKTRPSLRRGVSRSRTNSSTPQRG